MENQEVTEIPAIKIAGQLLDKMPEDLYIPPDALQVFLETFEGPLDLLLYLIKKQNIDILDIPIAEITRQYVNYIDLMQSMRIELAAEYLVMAAMLAEIKSRLLLPRPVIEEEGGEDPRAELVRRLQEYERFKKAAEDLDALPRLERDIYIAQAQALPVNLPHTQPDILLPDLLAALVDVLKRAELYTAHTVTREVLSVKERMSNILSAIVSDRFMPLTELFKTEEGRMGVVVTLMALLELIKRALIELVQTEPFSAIYIKSK